MFNKFMKAIGFKGKKQNRYGDGYALNGSGGGFVDAWQKQLAPNNRNLIAEYENACYSCANINATTVATVPLRLYATSKKGQKVRFWDTKTLNRSQQKNVSQKFRLTSGDNIEEVVEHPILDLLNNPNENLDYCQLFEITQLYQEIIGTAYWYVVRDQLGRPQNIYYLLSQYVVPVRDHCNKIIAYDYGIGCEFRRFNLDEIIVFAMPNLHDEIIGYSPLRAVWESVNLSSKIDATQQAMLDNNARPDLIVSPKGDGYCGENEKARYITRFNQAFSRAGSGGVLFLDEDSNVEPLNFSPKDLSVLQFKQVGKIDIANAFGVPMAMLETSAVNRANLEGSRMQHALNAITPRIRRLENKLNKYLVRQYEPSGRLFLSFDDPSPENRQEKQAELTGYVGASIITKNEARYELGLPEHEDGNDLIAPMPGLILPNKDKETEDNKPETETVDSVTESTPVETDNVQQAALNGAQITSLVSIAGQVAEGLLPLETARAIIAASFPTLTTEQISGIVSPLINFEPDEPEPKVVTAQPEPTKPDEEDEDDDDPNDKPPKGGKSANVKTTKALSEREQKALQGLPDGKEIAKVVSKFFNKLSRIVLGSLKKGLQTKNTLPNRFVDIDEWVDELASEVRPYIELTVLRSGTALMDRVGVSPELWNVTNPLVADAIDKAALAFCTSTLATTSQELQTALEETRDSLGEGLLNGDRIADLTDRVQAIFDTLSDSGAERIARTEAARAHHMGWEMAAEASGVVVGKRWLVSPDDPDGRCAQYANKVVPLGANFDVIESGNPAYDAIPFPPLHPHCKCGIIEVLDTD